MITYLNLINELQQNEIKSLKDTINEINEKFKNILYQQSIIHQNDIIKNNTLNLNTITQPGIIQSFISPNLNQPELKKEDSKQNIFNIPQNLGTQKDQITPFLFEPKNNITFKNLSENKNTKINFSNKILTNSIMTHPSENKMETEENKQKLNNGFIFNTPISNEISTKNELLIFGQSKDNEVLFPYLKDDK